MMMALRNVTEKEMRTVILQAALQARVLCPSRPLRYWILTGVLAVAGAGASARIAFR